MDKVEFGFSDSESYVFFREGISQLLAHWFPAEHTMIEIAINEAINNAFIHGCRACSEPLVRISLWKHADGSIGVRIADCGRGFPTEIAREKMTSWFKQEEALLKESGRGMWIMHHVFDEIRYNEAGNEVTLIKK